MKKKIATLIVMTTLLMNSCTNKDESNKIIVGAMPSISNLPIFYGVEEGIFEEKGLEVEVEKFFSAKDRDIAYIGRKINFVSSDLLGILSFHKSEIPTTTITKVEENFGIVASKNSNITSIKQIEGEEVLYSKNSIIEYTLDKALEKNKIPNEKINKVSVPSIPLRTELLLSGDGVVAVLPEPFLSTVVQKGGIKLEDSLGLGINIVSIGVNIEFLKNNKKEVDKFIIAYDEIVNILNNMDYGQLESYVYNFYGFDENIKDTLEIQKFNNITPFKQSEIEEVLEWAKNNGNYTQPILMSDLIYSK